MLHLQQTNDPLPQALLALAFPDSPLVCDTQTATGVLEQAFTFGGLGQSCLQQKLALRGSPFQLKVWQALRDIPFGETRSYGQLAESLGHPGAARAVGTAVAANKLAYLVPCHRVVRANGETGQFRWGAERKMQILTWESKVLADWIAAR